MLYFATTPENTEIIRRAHQMRAEAMSNILRSFVALFRRKAVARPNSV